MAIYENGIRIVKQKEKTSPSHFAEEMKELGTLREENEWMIEVIKRLVKQYVQEFPTDDLQEKLGIPNSVFKKIFPPREEVVNPNFKKV